MTLKKSIRIIHLWLGLSSGLVVFIVAITGAIWTFESEIQDVFFPYRSVKAVEQAHLPPSVLIEKTKFHFEELPVTSIDYKGKSRASTLSHWSEQNGETIIKKAFINPYSGEVLKLSEGYSFFDYVIELHINLLLDDIGRQIVDYATLIFLIMLISGIILWWPKSKSAAKQRFWFKWKEGLKWKRKNYDLHNILGFYASWIVIFMTITGLAWGFEWMNKTIYYVATMGAPYKEYREYNSSSESTLKAIDKIEDKVYSSALSLYNKPFESTNIYIPKEKTGAISVNINPNAKTWYKSESFYFDKRTAAMLGKETFEKMNNGEKIRRMYYDIHIGKILGLPGQFLVFFASIIVASLPITGFYIWWGRNKKSKTKLLSKL